MVNSAAQEAMLYQTGKGTLLGYLREEEAQIMLTHLQPPEPPYLCVQEMSVFELLSFGGGDVQVMLKPDGAEVQHAQEVMRGCCRAQLPVPGLLSEQALACRYLRALACLQTPCSQGYLSSLPRVP